MFYTLLLGESPLTANAVVVRLIENVGKDISAIKLLIEKPLPLGLIENGKIIDEIGFYYYLSELFKELGIKKRYVRFYVPNSLIIMREIEFPSNLKDKEIKEYIQEEIGKSIHLPFKEPVFDVHYERPDGETFDNRDEMQKGMLFAAPQDEMLKYTEILDDVSLKPIVADVEPIGIYRYFHHIYEVDVNKVYMFVQLNVNSINLSIFHNNQLDFIRYQNLDVELKGWHINQEIEEITWEYEESETDLIGILEDQIVELERIMNFYRFSIKKGELAVNEMVVLGDHPLLEVFYKKLSSHFDIPTTLLNGYVTKEKD